MRTSAQTRQHSTTPRSRVPRGLVLQRKCACGASKRTDTECKECNGERLSLRRYSAGRAPLGLVDSRTLEPESTVPNPGDDALVSLGHNFSQVGLHARSARRIQTKSHATQSRDRYEQEADDIAERVLHSLGNGGSASDDNLQVSDVSPSIQRSPDAQEPEAAPTASSNQITRAPAMERSPEATAELLIVDDDVSEVGPGQMRKTEFLDQLQLAVCAAADAE